MLTWLAALRDAIDDDILLRQTKDVLRPEVQQRPASHGFRLGIRGRPSESLLGRLTGRLPVRKIMENIMPRYLAQRTKTPLDVNTALLGRVTLMKDYLCEQLQISGPLDQERCLQDLCTGLVGFSGADEIASLLWESEIPSGERALFSLLNSTLPKRWKDWAQPILELRVGDQLLAAIMVKAYNLVRMLLPRLLDYNFDNRSHRPLSLAVQLKNDKLLEIVLDYLQGLGKGSGRAWISFWAEDVANRALMGNHVPLAISILTGLQTSGYQMDKPVFSRWLECALRLQSLDLARTIHGIWPECLGMSPKMCKQIFKMDNIEVARVQLRNLLSWW